MPYQITYFKTDKKMHTACWCRRWILTVCLFLLFSILVSDRWPEGAAVLRQALFPPETVQAAEVFAQELNCGYSFADAAGNFLMTIGAHESSD